MSFVLRWTSTACRRQMKQKKASAEVDLDLQSLSAGFNHLIVIALARHGECPHSSISLVYIYIAFC